MLSLKFVVSTTIVSPSHRPRESPRRLRMAGADVRPSVERTTRAAGIISGITTNSSGACTDLQVRVVAGRQTAALRAAQ